MVTASGRLDIALTANDIERFHRDGYHIARELFSTAEMDGLRDVFMAEAANGPIEGLSETEHHKFTADDPLSKYPRMLHPHRHEDMLLGRLSKQYLLEPRLEAYLSAIFDDEPIAAQSMFYFKPPGARGQDFHQDNFYLRVKPGNCLAAWDAVDDCDEENGAMKVVPTSNRLDLFCPGQSDLTKSFTNHHVPIPPELKAQT